MKTTRLCVILITLISFTLSCKTDDQYESTISKAVQFLINTNDRYEHDALVLIQMIYAKTGKKALKDIYKREKAKLLAKRDPFNILLGKGCNDRNLMETYLKANLYRTRETPNGQPIFSTRAIDDIIIRALYCKYFPFTSDIFDFMVEHIRDNGGYFSTHTFYALQLLKENACYDIDEIDKFMLEIAGEIENAQLSDDRFSDLYAERAMLLLHCGYHNKVRRSWINRITESQNKDGSWSMYGTGGKGRVHPTVLSMAAILLYYQE